MSRRYRAWIAKTMEERLDFATYEEAKAWALETRAKYGDVYSPYYFEIDQEGEEEELFQ